MKTLAKIIVAVLLNALGLWGAATYVPGFVLRGDLREILSVAVILTALNFVLKPILKLVLGPVIILTLGLGILIVNGVVLYLLDYLVPALTIETLPALLAATLFISILNTVYHFATK